MSCAALITRDLTLAEGAGFRQRWRWLIDGEPIDMSSWSGTARGRDRHASGSVWFDADTTNGLLTLDADGNVTIDLPDDGAHSTVGAPRQGVYDVHLTPPGGQAIRFADGALRLKPRVVTA